MEPRSRRFRHTLTLAAVLLSGVLLRAEAGRAQDPERRGEPPEAAARADTAQVSADSARVPADSTASEGGTLIPIPVLFYQPETGIGFGASGIYYFPLGGTSGAPRSSVAALAIYTEKSQLILSAATELYFREDRHRLLGEVTFSRFPTKFWGVGNEAPEEAEEDYTPETLSLLARPVRRIADGWFVGASLNFAHRVLDTVEEGGQLDRGVAPGAVDGQALGAGLLLIRDTRSHPVYPRRGSFHQLSADLYGEVLGADFGFGTYALDLRWYAPPFERHVIALQAVLVATSGSPPFDYLPGLGGDRLLRGYYEGRYRDRDLLALQAEYRMPVWWRIGLAGFVGVGQVARDLSDLAVGDFRASAGLGLRFLLTEREGLNIRADLAVGEGTSGFYLALGEAF